MGIFNWFQKSTPQQTLQSELKRLAPILFPGGHDEIANTGRTISALLDNRIPPDSASKLYTSAKYLAYTSTDKSRERMVSYIQRQGMGLIGTDDAVAIYDRYINNNYSPQNTTLCSASVTRTTTENPGSRKCPIIIEPPERLETFRRQYRDMLRETQYAHLAKANEIIDPMIAEAIKMARLEVLLGKEGKDWQCGERIYMAGAIQSQQVIFKDGRPVVLMYFDFSRFGGSLDWDSKS